MENATIVTLGPVSDTGNVSSFEQAFGEFSNAFGRGRARRQKRRLDRIRKRQELRRARQEGRAEQQQARQARKDERKRRRLARKEMGQEEEGEEEGQKSEESSETPTDGSETPSGEESSTPSDEGSSSGEESSPEGEESGFDGDNFDGDNFDGDNFDGDNFDGDNFDGDNFDGDNYGADGDESGFDGLIATEDYFSEFNDENRIRVNPKLKEITRNIEWNKELIVRLKIARAKALKKGDKNSVADINKRIINRIQRINKLRNSIANYSNASGNPLRRRREILKAKAMARKERMIARRKRMRGKVKGRVSKLRDRRRRMHGGSETPVSSNLNPTMSKRRIFIPGDARSNATGLNGIDLAGDFDAPNTRLIELKSNAVGDKKPNINWTGVAIGVGVVAILYFANKKYKFLGK